MASFIALLALVLVFVPLRKMAKRLDTLELQVEDLTARLADRTSPAEEPITAPTPWGVASAETIALSATEPDLESILDQSVAREAAPDQVEDPAAPATFQTPDHTKDSKVEIQLGTRWAVWVGGLALAFGGLFLVRYSIEAGYFGPAMRTAFAALFGLILALAGEFTRRRQRDESATFGNAHIPAILTAASAFTLFATVWSAHVLYDFIGTGPAFALLGLVAIATITASLLHGPALAGLGLLGAYAAPLLVNSTEPNPTALMSYVSIVLVASMLIAALHRWRFLALGAVAGAGIWSLVQLVLMSNPGSISVLMCQLVALFSLAFIWLRKPHDRAIPVESYEPEITENSRPRVIRFNFGRGIQTEPVALSVALFAGLCAYFGTVIFDRIDFVRPVGLPPIALLIPVMMAVALMRPRATMLLHIAGLTSFLIIHWLFTIWGISTAMLSMIVMAALLMIGLQLVTREPERAGHWVFWAALLPLAALALQIYDLSRFADLPLTLARTLGARNSLYYLIPLTIILYVASEALAARERPARQGGQAVSLALIGGSIALYMLVDVAFSPYWATLTIGALIAVPALLAQKRDYEVLGWLSTGFAGATVLRMLHDPTLVAPEHLSLTPIFNQLLPGYLVPAIASVLAVILLGKRWSHTRPFYVLQAFAALFALVGVAMLVRHAMNHGDIYAENLTLAEQSIYSLIMIFGGMILLALDQKSPSLVFRILSILIGLTSVISIATMHFLAFNPYLTGEPTGSITFFNLLFLAYLLPSIAIYALARQAYGKRPQWYVALLDVFAAALLFTYVNLSVRRIFQGEVIDFWQSTSPLETYAYSAVWLLIGFVVLMLGIQRDSRSLRLISAGLVTLAVLKVFLFDMRELEGFLRALSFIGLGAVLILIGLVYQKMMSGSQAGRGRILAIG